MTELSFLIHLLLDFKLTKPLKIEIANRIKEIDGGHRIPVALQTKPAPLVQPVVATNDTAAKALADRQAAIEKVMNNSKEDTIYKKHHV